METPKTPHMGEGSTVVFSGNSQIPAIQETYGKTAKLFAKEISARLKNDKAYTLLDIGTSRGELLGGLLSELPMGVVVTNESLLKRGRLLPGRAWLPSRPTFWILVAPRVRSRGLFHLEE